MSEIKTKQNVIEEIIGTLMRHEGALSFSSLSKFKESPKTFIDYKLKKIEQTDAMIFGSMVHCLILEPDEFESRYHILEDAEICAEIGGAKPRATNEYKDWVKEQEGIAGRKTIIDKSNFDAANIMSLNVTHNYAAKKILKKAIVHEYEIEWFYKNFKFKGYIDGYGEDLIFDLKTCTDAEPRTFQRDIINNEYYLQAAMYLKGIGEVKPYYIIAIDRSGGVSVHQLSDALIEHGLNVYDILLDKFNECILQDGFNSSYEFWSERFDGIFLADKPGYLY